MRNPIYYYKKLFEKSEKRSDLTYSKTLVYWPKNSHEDKFSKTTGTTY